MHISATCSHWYLRSFLRKQLVNFVFDFSELGSGPNSWQSRLWGGKNFGFFFPQLSFSAANYFFFFFFWGWLTSEVCKWQTKNRVPQKRTTSWNDISAYTLYAAILFLFPQQIHCRVGVILMSIVRIIIASRWTTVINRYLRVPFTL